MDTLNSSKSPTHSVSRLGRIFNSKHEKETRIPTDAHRGDLEMAIRYAENTQKLIVLVLQGRNFLPVDKKSKSGDPYVAVKLISCDTNKTVEKRKTGTARDTLSPIYDNHFEIDVNSSDLLNYKLQFVVKDATNYGLTAKIPILGELELRLDQLINRELPQQWIGLEAPRK